MKILVFGAGVPGCNLARDLFRPGKDVTLLARGAWGEEIRRNGLRIKDKFSPRMSVSRIPVVTELRPEDRYDVIFVVTRCTQLDSVREVLRMNPTENLVFVGNDVRADALAASLPGKNVLFAFASAAGHRERDHGASIDLKKITIGQLAGAPSNEVLIGRIFDGTKYKVAYEPTWGTTSSATRPSCCRRPSPATGRTRPEKAQGQHGLPEPPDRRQYRGLPRHPERRPRDPAQRGHRL